MGSSLIIFPFFFFFYLLHNPSLRHPAKMNPMFSAPLKHYLLLFWRKMILWFMYLIIIPETFWVSFIPNFFFFYFTHVHQSVCASLALKRCFNKLNKSKFFIILEMGIHHYKYTMTYNMTHYLSFRNGCA